MQYRLYSPSNSTEGTDVTVIGVFQDENIAHVLKAVLIETGLLKDELAANIEQTAAYDKFTGKANQQLLLPTYGTFPSKKILLYGLGSNTVWNASFSRKMSATIAKVLRNNQPGKVIIVLRDSFEAEDTTSSAEKEADTKEYTKKGKVSSDAQSTDSKGKTPLFKKLTEARAKEHVRAIAEGWTLGSYSFTKYKSTENHEKPGKDVLFEFAGLPISEPDLASACHPGQTIADATNLARQLIAEPACYLTPTKLAEQAKSIADEHGLSCQIMAEGEIEKLGMGSFLGVARGAKEPLRFIVMKYLAPQSKKTVAIIGKGITFDSGGLSLKPANSMEHMKYDMAGAAAVIGAMQVVAIEKPAVSVIGIVAATENMPGSGALHPGDVLQAMNGKTIEVNNTDAEGRLILADALTYAVQQGADEMIDLATLTGAIVTALGRVAAGIMGNNQELIDNVIKSGAKAGEKLWQMPMFEEYKESLKSDIADLKNAGARGEAGSSAAAMFLQEFCGGKTWAHLDIAGPGWLEKPREELNKGGTAFGVRTLSYYLLNL